ncbi:MAG TPA: hypothetical protein VGJ54_19055, partial [Streptosporangiaceae bacterium]
PRPRAHRAAAAFPSQALDVFWANEGDQSRHQRFARAAITPLYTRGEPIFVREVHDHLAKGLMPGVQLDHEATWRPRQPWEEQTPSGTWTVVHTGGPAVTGSP